ncbi:helix-turn-helix transcriptional regulator [Paractinoplanes atraurantiacus]|uniref:Regulatory protein, luxR family n=1 Tax=Paractinoplanes atraurantiacus TaxID=1036182 RepID=A0A285HNZ9_9ACTN|nr:AAA family ATPase [Actinoplanes atraurantiacus]SNY37384.1 regulatory protein, luxR family [Actinoplanes atraurantiacus]
MELLGRRQECATIDRMIAAVRSGESRVLVLHGGAGVGKTALLDYARRKPAGLRVLRAAGVESEMELAFAALHQLCGPLLDLLPRLPEVQRHALETVLGLRTGTPPDRFLVGLAVLSLLSEASEQSPLLCVVDDAQWLDRASAQTLSFVARRLLAESVALLFASREREPALIGLPELEITGLRDGDAHALLSSLTHAGLDRSIRDRIVAETRGNPLALVELPRGLSLTQIAGGLGLLRPGDSAPGHDSLPGHIERSFLNRIDGFAGPTRTLLLIAAAEPLGDPVLVWAAAERLGIDPAAALADGTDGLLSIDERVTFRHPLVRSAVYQAGEPRQRRAVHLALAEVTDETIDPDRRAWHRAAAAPGPDEEVAAELERSAGRAQARGGLAAAAAFLQRSVQLSLDTRQRVRRALAAAEATLAAGDFEAASRFADLARREATDEFPRARSELIRGHIAFSSGRTGEAPGALLAAAQRLEPHDMDLARETYLLAWGAALMAGDRPTLEATARSTAALPPREGGRRALDLVLDGYAELLVGRRPEAVRLLREATPLVIGLPLSDAMLWGWVANAVPPSIWDDAAMRELSDRQVEVVRAAGALAHLPLDLTAAGMATSFSGDLDRAAALAAEAETVASALGLPISPYVRLRLTALRGREPQASALLAETVARAEAKGEALGVAISQWSSAVLNNGLGRFTEAMAAARVASGISVIWVAEWALPELVEAAARVGSLDVAREALDRLTEITAPCDTDWAQGTLARCRALLSDAPPALFHEAIERLGRTGLRAELARAELLYGEWLRRNSRPTEAREHLRKAHEMFTGMGLEAFAERARRELLGTGEAVRKRTAEAPVRDELTAQERQIAVMARDGFSNPEVGERLFLSPRTVEWHLRKVFTKLGVTSRRQLREALPRDPASSPGP